MKKPLFILLLVHFYSCLYTQTPSFDWVTQTGWTEGGLGEKSFDLTIDHIGNIYTMGLFANIVDFDSGPNIFALTPNGEFDAYILKQDKNGNFLWAKSIGGGSYDQGFSITTDSFGNVFAAGEFRDTVDFDPGPNESILISNGETDGFVTKFDGNGNFIWAKQFGGIGLDLVRAITVDAVGNLYAIGDFVDTVDFDPGPAVFNLAPPTVAHDFFICKLDGNSNFIWAKQFGGSGPDQGNDIKLDSDGNIYSTGRYFTTVDFDLGPGVAELHTDFYWSTYILKLDMDGNFIWVKGLQADHEVGNNRVMGKKIFVDPSANIYTIGCFTGLVDFDPGLDTFFSSSVSLGSDDVFISKLDSNGVFKWSNVFGGTNGDRGYSITVDKEGSVYSTGAFLGTVDFDSGANTFNLNSNNVSTFLSKVDSSGNFIWASHLAGSVLNRGHGITLDEFGNILTTGYFRSGTDFDPGPNQHILSADGIDAFLLKLRQCLATTQIHSDTTSTLCPGDSLLLTAQLSCPFPNASYLWSNGDTASTIWAKPENNIDYSVSINYNESCNSTDETTLSIAPPISATINGITEICAKDTTVLLVAEGHSYLWSTEETNNNITIQPTENTDYRVTITDEFGCTASDSIQINVYPLPEINILGDSLLCPGDSVLLSTTEMDYYLWNTGEESASILVAPPANTLYTVEASNDFNCMTSDSILLLVDEIYCLPCQLVVPNAFTPNGDGQNDSFFPLSLNKMTVLDFKIYNRWGELVHDSPLPWDGTHKGKTQGTELYLYQVRVKTRCGVEVIKGEVTLLR